MRRALVVAGVREHVCEVDAGTVATRVGAGIAAEIGSMVVTDQVDALLGAELDRLIAENNAKLAANHLAMQSAIADAQSAISTAIEKLK